MAKLVATWTGSIAAFVVFIIVTQFMIVEGDRYPISGDSHIEYIV